MNVKLLVGIVLFVIGLATAVVSITRVANPRADDTAVVTTEQTTDGIATAAGSMVMPFVAAISLAVGGLLIGISFGNWKHPRAHHEPGDEVVNPEGYHKMKHV